MILNICFFHTCGIPKWMVLPFHYVLKVLPTPYLRHYLLVQDTIYFGCAIGSCCSQCIVSVIVLGTSTIFSTTYSLKGYKYETLQIGGIPMFCGISISYEFEEKFLKSLQGLIFISFNLLYSPLGYLSFHRNSIIKYPTSKFTSLFFKFSFCLYFLLLSYSFYLNFSCNSYMARTNSSPSTLIISKFPKFLNS